jgi:hypothetical protein
MFQIHRHAGRLVEARISGLANVARVDAFGAAFKPILREIGDHPILCADHRRVAIYTQPVADRLVQLFASLKETWFRVAIIVAPTNATLAMQLQRLVREVGNPARRVFFDAGGARDFLSEVLDPAERARLIAFLETTG